MTETFSILHTLMHLNHPRLHVTSRHKYTEPDPSANMAPPTDMIVSTILSFLQVVIGSLSLLQAYYMHQNLRLAISQTQKLDRETGQIPLSLPMPVPVPVPVPVPMTGRRPSLAEAISSHLLHGPSLGQRALSQPMPPRRILYRQQTSPLLLTR